MTVQPIYKTGTATVTTNSATVTGVTTAWALALVNGGTFGRNGLSIPIVNVVSDTELTLAYPAPAGMAGTGTYAISLGRADAASAIVANRSLADLTQLITDTISPFWRSVLDDPDASAVIAQNEAIEALGALEVNVDTLPYFNGVNTAAVTAFTSYARELLAKSSAGDVLTNLGFSTFVKGTVNIIDKAAFRQYIGSGSIDEVNAIIDQAQATLDQAIIDLNDAVTNALAQIDTAKTDIVNSLSTSTVLAAAVTSIGIGRTLTGDRATSLDLHSAGADTAEARLVREAGANGLLKLIQTGTGDIDIIGGGRYLRNGKKQWKTVREIDFKATPIFGFDHVFDDDETRFRITYSGMSIAPATNSSLLLRFALDSSAALKQGSTSYYDIYMYGANNNASFSVAQSGANTNSSLTIGVMTNVGISYGEFTGGLGLTNLEYAGLQGTYLGYSDQFLIFNRAGYINANEGGNQRHSKIGIFCAQTINGGKLVIEAY